MAKRMLSEWGFQMDADELSGTTHVALCEAAQRFDAERGCRFSTFFYHALRGHLLICIEASAKHSKAKAALFRATLPQQADADPERKIGEDTPELNIEIPVASPSPEELMMDDEAHSLIASACKRLPEIEQDVLRRTFTLNESPAIIARALRCSRRRVQEIKRSALERLRKSL
jgi:RNA polymerase sigma factor (sigma-70 family)